jgi:hypothetical protein
MATQASRTSLDRISADDLSRRFNRVFETLEVEGDLFSDDAFFDLNMPVWRFQLQGPGAWEEQLRAINQGPSRIDIVRTVATADGFVTEHVEHQAVEGEDHFARRLWLCSVDHQGRICHTIGYCSGDWDEALRERHAREAPMVRP